MLIIEPRNRDRTNDDHFFDAESERHDMGRILMWIRSQEWHDKHICFLGGSMMGMQALAAAGAARQPHRYGNGLRGGKFAVVPVVSCNRLHTVMMPARGGYADAQMVALELLCKWSYLMFKLIAPGSTHPVEFILKGMLFVDRILRSTYRSLPIGSVDSRVMSMSTRSAPAKPGACLKYFQNAMAPGAMEATSKYWRAMDHIAGPLGTAAEEEAEDTHARISRQWHEAGEAAATAAAESDGRVRATFVAGWHDFFLESQLLDFVSSREAFEHSHTTRAESHRDRRGPRLVVGGFTHFAVSQWRPVAVAECLRRMREMELDDDATSEWAKRVDDEIELKPVRVYFLGSNAIKAGFFTNPHESGMWGCYDTWPPQEATARGMRMACEDGRGAATSNGGRLLLTDAIIDILNSKDDDGEAAVPTVVEAASTTPLKKKSSASNLLNLASSPVVFGAKAMALAIRGTVNSARHTLPMPVRGIIAGVTSIAMPSVRITDNLKHYDGDGCQCTRYVYRPLSDPTPLRGGRRFNALDAGSLNQATVESRPDVAVFTSDALPSDLWIAGAVKVRVFVTLRNACHADDSGGNGVEPTPSLSEAAAPAPEMTTESEITGTETGDDASPSPPATSPSSSHRDACSVDLVARLCDVDDTGISRNISEGYLRLTTAHDGLNDKIPIQAEVPCGSVAAVFLKGHRVRLQVCSGAFPAVSRNLGCKEPLATADERHAVDQHVSLHYGLDCVSELVLPTVRRPAGNHGMYYPPVGIEPFFNETAARINNNNDDDDDNDDDDIETE